MHLCWRGRGAAGGTRSLSVGQWGFMRRTESLQTRYRRFRVSSLGNLAGNQSATPNLYNCSPPKLALRSARCCIHQQIHVSLCHLPGWNWLRRSHPSSVLFRIRRGLRKLPGPGSFCRNPIKTLCSTPPSRKAEAIVPRRKATCGNAKAGAELWSGLQFGQHCAGLGGKPASIQKRLHKRMECQCSTLLSGAACGEDGGRTVISPKWLVESGDCSGLGSLTPRLWMSCASLFSAPCAHAPDRQVPLLGGDLQSLETPIMRRSF